MQSFAFWYEADKKVENIFAKLNFNLWTECGWKKNPQYLDIGFLLNNWGNAKKLNFFVPFKVEVNNICDLGEFFKVPELASAIFNENLQPAPEENLKCFEIKNKDNDSSFLIYCLDENKDLHFESYNESDNELDVGTIISIDLSNKSLDKSKQLYFRFRIKDTNFENLVKNYSSDTHGLQSVFNTTYTVDFRFLNKRTLNKSLLEMINKHFIMPIDSIHFLLMTKTHVNLITTDCQGRKLEEKIWNAYINNNPSNDLIAYHFRTKFKTIEMKNNTEIVHWKNIYGACDYFIKYEIEKSIWPLYLLLTIGLGTIGSFLATLFTHYVFPKC